MTEIVSKREPATILASWQARHPWKSNLSDRDIGRPREVEQADVYVRYSLSCSTLIGWLKLEKIRTM